MALFPFDNVATVVSDAAVELGLVTSNIADPYAATVDVNTALLARLLKSLGRDLLREYEWSHRRSTFSVPTVNGTSNYAGPSDFVRFIDGTLWNPVRKRRVFPASPQVWEELRSAGIVSTVSQYIRVAGAASNSFFLEVSPTPTSAENITFEYMSNLWVRAADDGDGDDNSKSAPTAKDDILCLDPLLLVRGLKLMYLRAKGMPSEAAQQDYEYTLAQAKAADRPAPALGLGGRPAGVHAIDLSNIPDSGYGN